LYTPAQGSAGNNQTAIHKNSGEQLTVHYLSISKIPELTWIDIGSIHQLTIKKSQLNLNEIKHVLKNSLS
jgi:hypothetical protein